MAGGIAWERMDAGLAHACAIAADARAYCWGSGDDGQLGNGGSANAAAPVPVAGGRGWTRISAGGFHTCGIDTAGEGFCWGEGRHGQLGARGAGGATEPTPVF